MCGIAGFVAFEQNAGPIEQIVSEMGATLANRGPNDSGCWIDPEAGVALAHRRLSVIDCSPAGHQPMASASGRYVLSYNGEIYNFRALRAELEGEGFAFRGHSDTEVMLAAFERWGVPPALARFNGMFALGVWDRTDRTLLLARDRLGEKPLYYGWSGKTFLFASQPKAILKHPRYRAEIDREALASYFRLNYIPAPRSIYRGLFKLPPGTFLALRPAAPGSLPNPEAYWSARSAFEQGLAKPFAGAETEAEEEFDRLLRDSVRLRLESDVPLGAFLSGGIDSSLVVAAMQAESAKPVKTFTIGFRETGFDEAPFAERVAKHLGTEHTEVYLTPQDAMDVIPALPTAYDEPFADSSQIPTLLVSTVTRRAVTVALSGDGGDELFGGYPRYQRSAQLWSWLRRFPGPLRAAVAGVLRAQRLPAALGRLAGREPKVSRRLVQLADLLDSGSDGELYARVRSLWKGRLVLNDRPNGDQLDGHARSEGPAGFLPWMMYLDLRTYLPDDILTKVDRASMAVALETRVPLLDHRIVEFAWRLPLDFRIRGGQTKWLLRKVLKRYVPESLFERPKGGFEIPIGRWLCGPLRSWAEALLDPRRLDREGFIDSGVVRTKWKEHTEGARDWQHFLWSVLMFESWLDHQRETDAFSGYRLAG